MENSVPPLTDGRRLRAERIAYGITRKAVAERLGLHRNTVLAWETTLLDATRASKYRRAVRELHEEAIR